MGTLELRTVARAEGLRLEAAPEVRAAAVATWRRRMLNEHESAPVFEALAEQLGRAGAAAALVREVREMGVEERRHGVLCGAVVEGLGGSASTPTREPRPLPTHDDVDPLEAVTRNLLSVCCLSETVAVSLITAERERMEPGPVRDVLTEILADEVGHARLGWRWLAAHAGGLDRARLGAYLRFAFGHLEAHERANLPLAPAPPDGARLGLCSGAESRALFYRVVERVVVPRLEAHGLPAADAWARRVA